MKHPLTKIVSWSHNLLQEVIEPGDLAVDLTAGNGHDTLMLRRLVGDEGMVVAFDIQEQALNLTKQRLRSAGVDSRRVTRGQSLTPGPGVSLIAASHAELDRYLSLAPKAVVANLGYLPGGDQELITRPETTLVALRKASELLAPGGRLTVVIYPGHDGGREESEQVDDFFRILPEQEFNVLSLRVGNRPLAPYLQVAEKSQRENSNKLNEPNECLNISKN